MKEETSQTPPSAVAHAHAPAHHTQKEGPAPVGPNGLAITSLVLGILAFLSGWFFMGFVFGIAAVILGIIGLKKPGGKGMSIAGIVTGGLGALSGILFTVIGGLAILGSTAFLSEYSEELNQAVEQALGQRTSDKTEWNVGETAQFGDFDVRITNVERDFNPESEFFAASEGNELVALTLEAKNTSDAAEYIGSFEFTLVANGLGKSPSFATKDPDFESGDLQAGATTTGNIVFEVPAGATNLVLQYDGFDVRTGEVVTYSLNVD